MHDYWNLSKKQRSEITDLTPYEDYELMRAGVPRAGSPPAATEYPVAPEPDTELFRVGDGLCFANEGMARSAANDAVVVKTEYNWETHANSQVVVDGDPPITLVRVYSEAHYENCKDRISANAVARKAFDAKKKAYDEALSNQDEALTSMREDWIGCTERAALVKRVRDTRDEYVSMTDGNVGLAETFLSKVFSQRQITMVDEWNNE